MPFRGTIMCGAAALLSACASAPGPACPAGPPGAASAASPRLARGDCLAVNRRQAYDPVAGRYYWQDPRTGKSLWENGTPRS